MLCEYTCTYASVYTLELERQIPKQSRPVFSLIRLKIGLPSAIFTIRLVSLTNNSSQKTESVAPVTSTLLIHTINQSETFLLSLHPASWLPYHHQQHGPPNTGFKLMCVWVFDIHDIFFLTHFKDFKILWFLSFFSFFLFQKLFHLLIYTHLSNTFYFNYQF